MKQETYQQIIQRHKTEIDEIRKNCKHDKIKCSADYSDDMAHVDIIEVECVRCGEHTVIFGFPEDDKKEFMKLVNKGKIKLNVKKFQYRMDYHMFVGNPKGDYNFIMKKFRDARFKDGLK